MQALSPRSLRQSLSMSRSPEAASLFSVGPVAASPDVPASSSSSPTFSRSGTAPSNSEGLHAQLTAVTLRHRSPPPASLVPASSLSPLVQSGGDSVAHNPSPPPPPPPPPLLAVPSAAKLTSPGRMNESNTVTAALSQSLYNHSQSGSLPKSPGPMRAPPPPPPPPPTPGSLINALHLSRLANAQKQTKTTTFGKAMHSFSPVEPQISGAGFAPDQLASTASLPAASDNPNSGKFVRQLSPGSPASHAAVAGRQIQQLPLKSSTRLQPPLPSSALQRSSTQQPSQQQAWQHEADISAETYLDGADAQRIGAVYAATPQPASLQGMSRSGQLQAGVKKGWPTVQTNPVYQKADAATEPDAIANLPAVAGSIRFWTFSTHCVWPFWLQCQ